MPATSAKAAALDAGLAAVVVVAAIKAVAIVKDVTNADTTD